MRKLHLDELGRKSIEEYKQSPKIPVTVVLDNIRSGLNVGSILRSCDAFAIKNVVLTGITARPPHREILKTAIGAESSVSWSYHEHIADYLRTTRESSRVVIIGIEQTDKSLPLHELPLDNDSEYMIVFGNEVEGINNAALELLDLAVEIPQFGTKHSLNVAVCAGIVLWYLQDRLRS